MTYEESHARTASKKIGSPIKARIGESPTTRRFPFHGIVYRFVRTQIITTFVTVGKVFSDSMLWTMWEAIARWDGDAKQSLGDSKLSREEALRLAVQTGHLLTWNEDRRGSIETGKDADLTVLGGNPLTCSEDEIKDLPVDLTIVGGHVVHESQPDVQS